MAVFQQGLSSSTIRGGKPCPGLVLPGTGRRLCALQAGRGFGLLKTDPGKQKYPSCAVPRGCTGHPSDLQGPSHPRHVCSSKTQLESPSCGQCHCDCLDAFLGSCAKLSREFHMFYMSLSELWLLFFSKLCSPDELFK